MPAIRKEKKLAGAGKLLRPIPFISEQSRFEAACVIFNCMCDDYMRRDWVDFTECESLTAEERKIVTGVCAKLNNCSRSYVTRVVNLFRTTGMFQRASTVSPTKRGRSSK